MRKIMLTVIILSFYSLLLATVSFEKINQLIEDKNFEEAKTQLEEMIDQDDENAEAYFKLGICWFSLGDNDEAVDAFEEATELDDTNAKYYTWLGNALGRKTQNASIFKQPFLAPRIKDAYKRAVELDSTLVGARIGLAQYYLMAPGIMGGDVEKARWHIDILLEMGELQGKFLLATYYNNEDMPDSAIIVYEQLEAEVGNDPQYYNFYNQYGYMLLNQKKYDAAIDKFKKQVELAPDRANPYDSLGDGYRAAGRIDEAIAAYKKALEIDPNISSSKDNLEELENE